MKIKIKRYTVELVFNTYNDELEKDDVIKIIEESVEKMGYALYNKHIIVKMGEIDLEE